MAISEERLCVLRSEERKVERWYIVDPGSADIATVVEQWRGTQRPQFSRARRAVAATVGFGIPLLMLAAAAIATAWLAENSTIGAFGGVLLTIVALIGGATLGVLAYNRFFPDFQLHRSSVPGVLELHSALIGWASNETAPHTLWELQVGLSRVQQILDATDYWNATGEADWLDPPEWAIENVVMPALRKQLAGERLRLKEVAERHGFPVPEGLAHGDVGGS